MITRDWLRASHPLWSQWEVKIFIFESSLDRKVLLGCWQQWKEEDIRKGCRRVNIVEVLCTPV
jgi:hypothetical protein